jgi:hypothetical protein
MLLGSRSDGTSPKRIDPVGRNVHTFERMISAASWAAVHCRIRPAISNIVTSSPRSCATATASSSDIAAADQHALARQHPRQKIGIAPVQHDIDAVQPAAGAAASWRGVDPVAILETLIEPTTAIMSGPRKGIE